MSWDVEKLRERFGAAMVSPWQPAMPAFAGFLPEATPVVSPADVEQLQECLRFAAIEGLRILPAGAMEHIGCGAPPARVDFVLSTRRLDRILAYEPGDLTLVAQAGVTLHEIARRTAEFGQGVAPAPWPGIAASVGGACAANRVGLRRLAAGTWRDAVLGCRVVHADGGMTKSGGNVVKNVTGYDLPKLYVGSCGSRAALTEINLRLQPRAEASALVATSAPPAQAEAQLLALHRGPWRPSAALAVAGVGHEGLPDVVGDVHILARFEGVEPVVRQQVKECAALWGGEAVDPERAGRVWEALSRHAEPAGVSVGLAVATLPVAVLAVLATVRQCCGDAATSVAEFGVGTVSVRLPQKAFPSWQELHSRLAAAGATVRCLYAPRELRRHLPAESPPAPGLQAAIKHLYDPERRLRDVPFFAREAVL